MEQTPTWDQCITGDQYEELAKRHQTGQVSDEQMAAVERHVITCAKCRSIWALEAELNRLPADVVRIHTESNAARASRAAKTGGRAANQRATTP